MKKIISPIAALAGALLIALSFTLSTQATCSNANCTPGAGTCNRSPVHTTTVAATTSPAPCRGIDVIGGLASAAQMELRVHSNSAQTPVRAQTLAFRE